MRHAVLALLLAAAPADPRVRIVPYVASDVVELTGHYGYQMLIELSPDERIQNISIGDSVAWLVTPNKTATGLFLKPVEPHAATNMTVQTDKHVYLFELKAARAVRGGATPGMTYKLAFRYPEIARATPAPAVPTPVNRAYRLSGAARLKPAQVFDDGRSTYFGWPPGQSVPAIFLVEDGGEALVNHRIAGGYVIVDRLAERFVLRAGTERVKVLNQGYGKPLAGLSADRPGGRP